MSNRTIPSHRQVELAINESFGSVAHVCAATPRSTPAVFAAADDVVVAARST